MCKNSYLYRIYGLLVQSEIEIPQAYAEQGTTGEIDVVVKIGAVPQQFQNALSDGYKSWISGFEAAWFVTETAAQFFVCNGNQIIVQPFENGNEELIRSMILSAGMALILFQRNRMVFHGSCVVMGEQAVIISGDSGAGKSTITMELLQRPIGFLADDTVHVHENEEGDFVAEPTYPQQKICRDMAQKYHLKLEALKYIDEDRDKFALPRREGYVTNPTQVKAMFILKKGPADSVVHTVPLEGGAYVEAAISNLYLANEYKNQVGVPPEIFFAIAKMEKKIPIYEIYRPEKGDSVNLIINEIDKMLQSC